MAEEPRPFMHTDTHLKTIACRDHGCAPVASGTEVQYAAYGRWLMAQFEHECENTGVSYQLTWRLTVKLFAGRGITREEAVDRAMAKETP